MTINHHIIRLYNSRVTVVMSSSINVMLVTTQWQLDWIYNMNITIQFKSNNNNKLAICYHLEISTGYY